MHPKPRRGILAPPLPTECLDGDFCLQRRTQGSSIAAPRWPGDLGQSTLSTGPSFPPVLKGDRVTIPWTSSTARSSAPTDSASVGLVQGGELKRGWAPLLRVLLRDKCSFVLSPGSTPDSQNAGGVWVCVSQCHPWEGGGNGEVGGNKQGRWLREGAGKRNRLGHINDS